MKDMELERRPLPDDVELQAELSAVDMRHWPAIRRRVIALRDAAAGAGESGVATAAADLGLSSERVYQLLGIWWRTGCVAKLVPGASRRTGVKRLPAVVEHIIATTVSEVLEREPSAGVEGISKEVRRRCMAGALKPPASMTLRRRINGIVEDAGGWNAVAERNGPPLFGLVVDRCTLGMPMRTGDDGEAGLPQVTLVVDLATSRVLAAALGGHGKWVEHAARALNDALHGGPMAVPLPLVVEIERDRDPLWREIASAFDRAGIRFFADLSPRPGAGRRIACLLGTRLGPIPILTRGMHGDAEDRLRRWRSNATKTMETVDPELARCIIERAVATHNAGRPSASGDPPRTGQAAEARRRASFVSDLSQIIGGGVTIAKPLLGDV